MDNYTNNGIDNNEWEAAEKAAEVSTDCYIHKFKKPYEWMGQQYEEILFDFTKLSGKDSLSIENELRAKGVFVLSPEFSGNYLVLMAAKASGLGSDAFEGMSIKDFNAIRSAARSFLM